MPGISVTMCVCRHFPFERLLPLARAHGWRLEDVVRETGCGGQCGLCQPYLSRMLATGETTFTDLISG